MRGPTTSQRTGRKVSDFLVRAGAAQTGRIPFVAACALVCGWTVVGAIWFGGLLPDLSRGPGPCGRVGGGGPAGAAEEGGARRYRRVPPWILPFNGTGFDAHRRWIDRRIDEYRASSSGGAHVSGEKRTCRVPLFSGEYGYEIAAMVPWAYYIHRTGDCDVITDGVEGTRYLYFFSHRHNIVNKTYVTDHLFKISRKLRLFPYQKKVRLTRKHQLLPEGNPFNNSRVHIKDKDFPKDKWLAPPFKSFFRREDLAENLDRPLVIIFNKFTEEWGKSPVNFIPINELRMILEHLTAKYYVVYIRLERKEMDDHSKSCGYGDKAMIRAHFPQSVVVMDDLTWNLSPDDVNLMIFSLASLSDRFLSVQGGNAVVASFFGGRNIILAKEGTELKGGDYTYYYRFSNATIGVVRNERDLVSMVKQRM